MPRIRVLQSLPAAAVAAVAAALLQALPLRQAPPRPGEQPLRFLS